jgi:hypothetical protein
MKTTNGLTTLVHNFVYKPLGVVGHHYPKLYVFIREVFYFIKSQLAFLEITTNGFFVRVLPVPEMVNRTATVETIEVPNQKMSSLRIKQTAEPKNRYTDGTLGRGVTTSMNRVQQGEGFLPTSAYGQ